MAKQGKGNSGKGGSSKGGECAAQGAINRGQIAKEARGREHRRQEEGPAFFLRLNADRNNNPADIANGVVGKYAIPGGDQPSIHLSVRKHNQKDTSFSVVEFGPCNASTPSKAQLSTPACSWAPGGSATWNGTPAWRAAPRPRSKTYTVT